MNWRPIETSPKTSQSRLVWCPGNQCCFIVSWGTHFGEDSSGDVKTWLVFGGYNTPLNYEPSHWAPLPEPPQ